MPRQAMNTLYSLSTSYQQQANDSPYEVIVIENSSDNNLDADQVRALGPQFSYRLRTEPGVSPAGAINEGLGLCQADYIGLMIDGARMLSPGVIHQALTAKQISDHPMAVVPSYDLGPDLQQNSHLTAYTQNHEIKLLESIKWPEDGYALFDIAVLGEANIKGYINPLMESTCLFCPASSWQEIGGADESFQQVGGGALNLHIFRQLGLLDGSELIVLAGEGAFHQFHGGVTTDAANDVDAKAKLFLEELLSHWDNHVTALTRMPVLLGQIPDSAKRFFVYSCERSILRLSRKKKHSEPPWQDDTPTNNTSFYEY